MIILHRVAGTQHPPHDPFQELAIAIIKQAADDYRAAGKMINKTGSRHEKKHLEQEMKSISRFFLSDWYHLLAGCNNGSSMLEMLDQEVFDRD